MTRAAIGLLLACLFATAAAADGVSVRVGNHEGYGRIVFNLPPRTDYHVAQQGQQVVDVLLAGT